jgi:hypothetical protein
MADTGAAATLLARPTWLWGAEHGVNEHRVAVGNERVYTVDDPGSAPDALLGMDLVRLALERARSASDAVDVLGQLLAAHGQGGVGDAEHHEAYFSSFLVADPSEAWVVDTSGRSWAARRVGSPGTVALSNRLSLRDRWDRASADVAPGTDIDGWRSPGEPTAHADRRLAVTETGLSGATPGRTHRPALGPADLVVLLRDHGHGRWPEPPPGELRRDFTGISVCMHLRGYLATTSSMVTELPSDPSAPLRCWVAAGAPCVSVYVPAFPPQPACPAGAVPGVLGDETAWRLGAALRDRVEADIGGAAGVLEALRVVLDPLEAELWAEADEAAATPSRWAAVTARSSQRVAGALRELAA